MVRRDLLTGALQVQHACLAVTAQAAQQAADAAAVRARAVHGEELADEFRHKQLRFSSELRIMARRRVDLGLQVHQEGIRRHVHGSELVLGADGQINRLGEATLSVM